MTFILIGRPKKILYFPVADVANLIDSKVEGVFHEIKKRSGKITV